MDEHKPHYWGVMPAEVRYCPGLPATAKVLYTEISALTQMDGICVKDNAYFCQLYKISERTLQRQLKALERRGYIQILDGEGGAGRRKIFAGINPLANPDKNDGVTPTKMSGPPDKNVTQNKKEIRKENDPPKAPQGASVPKWKPERFEAFWRYYPAIPDGNGHGRRPAKDRAARAWDRLRPDDQTLALMGQALRRQKESRQWREGVGIPYASTWLNRRAWEEELEDLEPSAEPAAASASEEALPWI